MSSGEKAQVSGRTSNHVFTHFCGKDQEGVVPRAVSAVKQSPWPIDDSREKRWDLEWLCAGCSHESRQREAYNHERSGSCRVLMWAQAATLRPERQTCRSSGALSIDIFEESRCSSAFVSLAQ